MPVWLPSRGGEPGRARRVDWRGRERTLRRMQEPPQNPGPGGRARDAAAPQGGSPRAWTVVSSEPGPDILVARVRFDVLTNPRTGADLRRLVLEVPAWVNVVARTADGNLVVVRQFRFGTRDVTTEIPGGMVDPGEEPLVAAKRELREETGYTSERWTCLGAVEPNPAFQDNLCWHYLAEDARRTHPLELDAGEDIVVDELPAAEVLDAIRSGSIRHSLVLTALSKVYDLRVPLARDSG